jgi:hypothetical protein
MLLSGIVVSGEDQPLEGALVKVAENNHSDETGPNGHYKIEVQAGQTLEFSKEGHKSRTITVSADMPELNVLLRPL